MANNKLHLCHSFLGDRFRAIRNDLTIQNYHGIETSSIYEQIARYHILVIHALGGTGKLDVKLEREHLRDTLMSLRELFQDLNKEGTTVRIPAEIQVYLTMENLWTPETRFMRLTEEPLVKSSSIVRKMLDEIRGMASLKSVECAELLRQLCQILKDPTTPFLFACCIETQLAAAVRRGNLRLVCLWFEARSHHSFSIGTGGGSPNATLISIVDAKRIQLNDVQIIMGHHP